MSESGLVDIIKSGKTLRELVGTAATTTAVLTMGPHAAHLHYANSVIESARKAGPVAEGVFAAGSFIGVAKAVKELRQDLRNVERKVWGRRGAARTSERDD